MLRLSLFKRTSNIANLTYLVISQGRAIASECLFVQMQSDQAYFSNPNHIKACERQTVKNYGLKINNYQNDWELEPKPNSGDNMRPVAILK